MPIFHGRDEGRSRSCSHFYKIVAWFCLHGWIFMSVTAILIGQRTALTYVTVTAHANYMPIFHRRDEGRSRSCSHFYKIVAWFCLRGWIFMSVTAILIGQRTALTYVAVRWRTSPYVAVRRRTLHDVLLTNGIAVLCQNSAEMRRWLYVNDAVKMNVFNYNNVDVRCRTLPYVDV